MSGSRWWVLALVIGAVICSVMIAYVTVGVAYLEFHHAMWTRVRDPSWLPFFTAYFRKVYWVGWLLPVLTALAGGLVFSRKLASPLAVACLGSVVAIAHVGWFLFWILALYLVNQSFVCGNQ